MTVYVLVILAPVLLALLYAWVLHATTARPELVDEEGRR